MTLKDKVVVITGGAQGIGKATAQLFLKLQAKVVIVDSDTEAGNETANEYSSLGEILFIQTDVSKESQVKKAVDSALNQFRQIDFLINNAGRCIQKPVESLSLEEWNTVMDTNITSIFLFAKYLVPHLKKSKGAIVNIASTRALMSEANTESYTASKGAVVAITHGLAISLGPDIRVNCICPGWIDVTQWKKSSDRKPINLTEADKMQHPVGRVGKPEDVASLAAYLVSAEASFITGANFVVDGGMTHKMIYV